MKTVGGSVWIAAR